MDMGRNDSGGRGNPKKFPIASKLSKKEILFAQVANLFGVLIPWFSCGSIML